MADIAPGAQTWPGKLVAVDEAATVNAQYYKQSGRIIIVTNKDARISNVREALDNLEAMIAAESPESP